jgi:septum formation protein
MPFETAAPHTDESALAGEAPAATALRLAEAKARAVANAFPDALIIGSDQVAAQGSQRFGKPGTAQTPSPSCAPCADGRSCSTPACACSTPQTAHAADPLHRHPCRLSRAVAMPRSKSYLDKEDALNCAGSAKSEGLGISLLSYLRGDDPNALIGLPLIALCDMLRKAGVALP